MNHGQRVALQQAISNTERKLDVESKYCVPRLADKTQKQEHFYNDTFKFAVCLPTKTGCTNWQRGLGEYTFPEILKWSLWNSLGYLYVHLNMSESVKPKYP